MDLTRLQVELLLCCYWHRLVTTAQLHQLLAPSATASYLRQQLRGLRAGGLLASTPRRRSDRQLAWYATPAGAAAAEASGEVDARPYRYTPTACALSAHTHDVIETGIAFVHAARRLAHDCGPRSWTPEVAHRCTDRGRLLIVDAVLHYASDRVHTFFVEVDRASMPVPRLAGKLGRYARYHDYVPRRPAARAAWRERYPRWPRVLVVLTGAPEHVLDRRLADLRIHADELLGPSRMSTRAVPLGTTLTALREHGPDARIFLPLTGDDRTARAVIM